MKPGSSAVIEAELPSLEGPGSLFLIHVALSVDGRQIDQMSTGIVREDAGAAASGPQLRFRDNYFTLNNRPLFLFGTDTYARTYQTAAENPATWLQELQRARDMGVNLYENLQYQRPGTRCAMTIGENFERWPNWLRNSN